nr:glycosyltransferase [Brachybacterium muris]
MAARLPHTKVFENWTAELPYEPHATRSDAPIRVGFLGRLSPEKGVDLLAHAIGSIDHIEGRPLRLVLAGESRFGTANDDQTVAQALAGMDERIDRLGWVRPEDFFTQVDLVVCPSRAAETFGLTAAEAMAAGVPVVVSDAGALPEVVGLGHPWIARSGDAEDLARVIVEAVTTEQPARDLVIEGSRQRWEQNYSPAAGRRRVASLLQGLAQGDRKEAR